MSALGQKQTSGNVWMMSAIHPKADIAGRQLNVRFVPKADIANLEAFEVRLRNVQTDVELHCLMRCMYTYLLGLIRNVASQADVKDKTSEHRGSCNRCQRGKAFHAVWCLRRAR
jgi:hypothetical protein